MSTSASAKASPTPDSFRISRTVPVPEKRVGAPRVYPWEHMGTGDSFLIEGAGLKVEDVNGVYSSARHHRLKIACKAEAEGVRVWLLERLDSSSPSPLDTESQR